MAQALLPRYALASGLLHRRRASRAVTLTYPSPGGTSAPCGDIWCSERPGPFPPSSSSRERAPQSLHRGRAPPGRDRGFLSLAPDGLFPVGEYIPAMTMTAVPSRPASTKAKLRTDMLNSARFLKIACAVDRQARVTGFCWGGSTTNFLAVASAPI